MSRLADATRPVRHFRRPREYPFTAEQRNQTTILFGGLTTAHDTLIEAVFESCGYRCQRLPTADLAAFHRGRQYCNTGQCNPTYFTVASVLGVLERLEASGMSRAAIIAVAAARSSTGSSASAASASSCSDVPTTTTLA
jgi:hypothetical protein